MKIALVCPYNYQGNGGVQECIKALHVRLLKLGHEVKVITPEPRKNSEQPPKDVLFLGSSANFNSPIATTTQLSVSVSDQEINELLAKYQFDVIHFHEPWVPIISQQILKRSSAAHVATFHAKLPESLMSRAMARIVTPYTKSVLKYLDAYTAVSPAAASYVQMLSNEPINYIPNGVDLSKYKPGQSNSKGKVKTILFFGRLERRKGVKYLIKAYAKLIKEVPDCQLLIGGDGPQRAKLEQLVEDFSIPNVSFLGFLPEDQKLDLLQSADIFCSPAVFGESFGIVLLEAMATNTVTVAGNNPGYQAVLSDVGQLSLVDPHYIDQFAARLKMLLTSNALRKTWQDWAKDYVKQFDYDQITQQYLKVYEAAYKAKRSEQPKS